MDEERIKILQMVQEGKVSAEQGAELLRALEDTKVPQKVNPRVKMLRVRVFDPIENTKVNVNVPISLLKVALSLGNKFAKDSIPDDIDLAEIAKAIEEGAEGKIVDVESDRGEKVEIYVE